MQQMLSGVEPLFSKFFFKFPLFPSAKMYSFKNILFWFIKGWHHPWCFCGSSTSLFTRQLINDNCSGRQSLAVCNRVPAVDLDLLVTYLLKHWGYHEFCALILYNRLITPSLNHCKVPSKNNCAFLMFTFTVAQSLRWLPSVLWDLRWQSFTGVSIRWQMR